MFLAPWMFSESLVTDTVVACQTRAALAARPSAFRPCRGCGNKICRGSSSTRTASTLYQARHGAPVYFAAPAAERPQLVSVPPQLAPQRAASVPIAPILPARSPVSAPVPDPLRQSVAAPRSHSLRCPNLTPYPQPSPLTSFEEPVEQALCLPRGRLLV